MYGKIFDSIYDGTLVENWEALITFEQMIVLCDADGVIDITPGALSRRTGIPVDIINRGIPVLESPDPLSRTPDEEGKRIVRMDEHRTWGWYLVNHEKYKDLQDYGAVKEQNRIRKQRQRERQKVIPGLSQDVTGCHAKSRHTDTDTDTGSSKDQSRSKIPESGDSGTEVYLTKKKRKLTGEQLKCFNLFWLAFNKKDGKAEAADAWIDLKVTTKLYAEIIHGATMEARHRAALEEKGMTTKWAQGWLTGRRWEKWTEIETQTKNKPKAMPTDWEEVGKRYGLKWAAGEYWGDFVQRVMEKQNEK